MGWSAGAANEKGRGVLPALAGLVPAARLAQQLVTEYESLEAAARRRRATIVDLLERLNRPQSTEELRSYAHLTTSSEHGNTYQWQFGVLDSDAYTRRTLETLTAGPLSAAVAGGVATARGGQNPSLGGRRPVGRAGRHSGPAPAGGAGPSPDEPGTGTEHAEPTGRGRRPSGRRAAGGQAPGAGGVRRGARGAAGCSGDSTAPSAHRRRSRRPRPPAAVARQADQPRRPALRASTQLDGGPGAAGARRPRSQSSRPRSGRAWTDPSAPRSSAPCSAG